MNPYQAPQASLERAGTTGPTFAANGRTVGAGHGFAWLTGGYSLAFKSVGIWIVIFILFFLLTIVASLIPVLGFILNSMLSSIFAAGLIQGAHDLDRGQPLRVGHLFSGFGPHAGKLMGLAGINFLATVVVFGGVIFAFVGPAVISGFASEDPDAILQALQNPMFMIGVLVAAGLLVPLMMAYWFAPALVMLNGMSVMGAMRASFLACLRNIVPFLVYGFVTMIAVVISAVPLGLGLLVTMPALIASIYVAFKDVFAPA